jgi:hypothetical protein
MGVPGKTRGHSIDIVLGGSRKNRTTMAGFNKALVNEAKDPNTDMNEGFKKAVLSSTAVNRAGTPTRMMNNNMMNQTDMGQMPFQNNAIMNAQGMKQMDMSVNPNIPGTLPGSGNVPGNQMIPNPVARIEGDNPKFKGTMLPELDVEYNPSGSGKSYNAATGEERDSTQIEMDEQRKDLQSRGEGKVTTSYVNPDTGQKEKLGSIIKASF